MKVFVDTNVLVDFLNKREPFFNQASIIVGLCEAGLLSGVVSSLSVVNCMYIARKMYPKEVLFKQLDWMVKVFDVSSIDKGVIKKAASLKPYDYEDAVQYLSAQRKGVDYIITRDKKGFSEFDIPSLTPDEFVRNCKA